MNDHENIQENVDRRHLLRPTIRTANLWYLLSAAGLPLLSALALLMARLPFFESNTDVLANFLNAFYEIGILALPVVIYACTNRPAARSLRLNRPDPGLLLLVIVLAAVGVLMANMLTTWWLLLIDFLGGTPQASGISIPADADSLLKSILLIGVIPGVCEEMLFRGGLMSAWETRGRRTALILTSVLFALLHGTVAGLPNQLIMGVVLGYILLISDSIYVSMTYHAVHNSVTLILAFLASKADITEAAASYADLNASMGGASGYAAMLMSTASIVTLFAVLLHAVIRRAKHRGANVSLRDMPDIRPVSPVLRLTDFVPLILALVIIAFNYAGDFIATFS